jgi:hypothetical protein
VVNEPVAQGCHEESDFVLSLLFSFTIILNWLPILAKKKKKITVAPGLASCWPHQRTVLCNRSRIQAVLTCLCCCNRIPKTGWFIKNRNFISSHFKEAGKSTTPLPTG